MLLVPILQLLLGLLLQHLLRLLFLTILGLQLNNLGLLPLLDDLRVLLDLMPVAGKIGGRG